MSQEPSDTAQPMISPIALDKSFLEGKGLTDGNPAEFENENLEQEEEAKPFRVHNFHEGKILVAVYETGPGKVHINGLPYDEFVQVLEGRLILTPDGGETLEIKQGESVVVPKGYKGGWHMPENYRELIIINADYNWAGGEES